MTSTHTIEDHFSSAMREFAPFEDSPIIAMAVSGGSDSMALAWLADRWAKKHGGQVIALTVDHGLRKDSATEAKQVKAWLEERGIPCHILIWKGEKPAVNIQAAAREYRYKLLTDWCRKHRVLHLLVAHHRDDQAETVLLRLFRGSGVDGLAAMAALSAQSGIRLLRPLLGIPKASLRQLVQEKGWPWVEDPSNSNEKFTRVGIRNLLAGQGEEAPQRVAETAGRFGRARALLEEQAARAMVRYVAVFPEGYARIKPEICELPEEIALRILSSVLLTVSGESYPTRYSHLLNLYKNLMKGQGFRGHNVHGCVVFPHRGAWLVAREVDALQGDAPVKGNKVYWDGRFVVSVKQNEKALIPASLTSNQQLATSNFHITAMTPERGQELCRTYPELAKHPAVKTMPKRLFYTLPVVATLEKTLAIPHINWISPGENVKILCHFRPQKPLIKAYFHYCRE